MEEIIELNGIDGVLIGPYDLSASMGYPGEFDREDVKEQLNKFKSICKNEFFTWIAYC